MHAITHGGIKYYQFESFPKNSICQAIFTRTGGVSPEPWQSLNQGGTTGDSRPRVVENRRLAFESVGLPVTSIYDVWQVHGTSILAADEPRNLEQPHEKADGIMTNRNGITLFMRFADCVPILLVDPGKNVIAIIHAGWQGTVKRIASIAVSRMRDQYGCEPSEILAGIGPSIGPDHYLVQSDVVARVKQAFPRDWKDLVVPEKSGCLFDLWAANRLSLIDAGVSQIETAGICTACNLGEWYSHRSEGGKTGRFGVLLALR